MLPPDDLDLKILDVKTIRYFVGPTMCVVFAALAAIVVFVYAQSVEEHALRVEIKRLEWRLEKLEIMAGARPVQ